MKREDLVQAPTTLSFSLLCPFITDFVVGLCVKLLEILDERRGQTRDAAWLLTQILMVKGRLLVDWLFD